MTDRKPGVSVVIASHDRLAYLKVALRSVSAQTFADYEIVLADDSTDGTRDWIRREKLPRLRYLRVPGDCGPATARNRALDAARGDYVAFLDSDDLWEPTYLESQLAAFADPTIVAATAGYYYIDGRGRRIAAGRANGAPLLLALSGRGSFLPSATVARADALVRVKRFDEEFRVSCEDTDLFVRLAAAFGPAAFRFQSRRLVGRRRHAGQKTAGWREIPELLAAASRLRRPAGRSRELLMDRLLLNWKHRRLIERVCQDR